MAFNRVILVGNLTADPELKTLQNGTHSVTFDLGVLRRYVKEGEPQTDFIRCVAWRQTADFICKFFKKGNAILVCGQLQTRSFTNKDGNRQFVVEVVVDEATFVEKKVQQGQGGGRAPSVDASEPEPHFDEIDINGDLPF